MKGTIALGLAFLIYPFVFSNAFYLDIGVALLLAAISASAWNIVGGYAGQVSVGHCMFFGAGAYLPLLVYHHWQLPPMVGVPLGIIVSLALAVIVGMPTFRLTGHYFSMATIAVAELIRLVIGTWDFVGAAIGLQGPAVGRGWWDLTFRGELPYYFIFLAVLIVLLLVIWTMERTRFGYYLRAIKAGERAARRAGCTKCGTVSRRDSGNAMLLSAENVSKTFGSLRAVAGANLAIDEGDIIGLIGPNGAGKSTFFNCLAGDTLPTAGRVVFDNVDVTRAPPEEHARLGIGRTFQVPATFEDMTVLDNVMVGAFLPHHHRADARAHALKVLELVGLADRQHLRARSLGTPGRKRLEIARVLATEPRLMLLDEALAGLTPAELQLAIALVRKIHETGITIVIVEHIMEVIMTLAKRVIVFNQGHVIAQGAPADVVKDEAVIEAYLGRGHRQWRKKSGGDL